MRSLPPCVRSPNEVSPPLIPSSACRLPKRCAAPSSRPTTCTLATSASLSNAGSTNPATGVCVCFSRGNEGACGGALRAEPPPSPHFPPALAYDVAPSHFSLLPEVMGPPPSPPLFPPEMMMGASRLLPHRPTFEEALLILEVLCSGERRAGCATVSGGSAWESVAPASSGACPSWGEGRGLRGSSPSSP